MKPKPPVQGENVVVRDQQVATVPRHRGDSPRSSTCWARRMSSIRGAWNATGATSAWRHRPRRSSTCRPMSRVTKTSTTTALGAPRRSTDTCGRLRACPRAGLPTNTVAGCGSRRGAGPGSMTPPGVTRPFTMAAGLTPAIAGAGCPGRGMCAPCMHPPSWAGSAALDSAIGVTSGPGRVGWFPLGPREVYVPARRYSPRYVERVNVTNAIVNRVYLRNVYENRGKNFRYRNRDVPGAVTAVDRNVFTSAGRVGDHRVRGDDREFSRAVATAMAPQIAPVRESRLGGAAHANVRVPPRNVVDRQVVVRREPPPAAAPLVRSTAGQVNTPRATPERSSRAVVTETVNRNRPDRPANAGRPVTQSAPRVQPTVPDRQAAADRSRADRAARVQQEREQARDQQLRREAEILQRHVQQDAQQHRQREQQQQARENSQRQQDSERRTAPRPVEQRERPVERPRVEQKQPETRTSRPAEQRPAESRPPKQQDDQPRPQRN